MKSRAFSLFLLAGSSCGLSLAQVAPPSAPPERNPNTAIILGPGKTTATCIDKDGDGYGLGPGCPKGPDADDNDPSVQTAKDVLAKYGSMRAFLNHHIQQTLGNPNFSVRKIFYVDASGKGGEKGEDEGKSHRSFSGIAHSLGPSDVVLFRAGDYPRMSPKSGSPGNPIVYMAYPGEVVRVDAESYEAFYLMNASWVIVDGFTSYSSYPRGGSQCVSGGSDFGNANISGPPLFHDVIIQNFDCANASRGMFLQNGLLNIVIQDSVVHDLPYLTASHPIYLGSAGAPSQNVTVRRNLVFNSGVEGNGVQFNGRVTNLVVDSNIIYNSSGAGISLLQGVSNSIISNNLVFNHTNGGIKIMDYYSGDPHILAYDQTGNVIENNTIWQGTNDWHDGDAISSSPIYVFHAGGSKTGNLGGNIFRNNILVTSFNADVPAIDFRDADGPGQLRTSTFQNNIVWSTRPTNIVAQNGPRKYDCAQLIAATKDSSHCINAKPLFVDVNTKYFNQPLKFNFLLREGSPAIGAGTPTGAPSTDLKGLPRPTPPSIGAYEAKGEPKW